MRLARNTVALSVAATAAAAVPCPASAGPAPPGGLIVGFSDSVSKNRRDTLVRGAGGTVDRRLVSIRGLSVHPRGGVAASALRRALERTAGVRYVESDYDVNASAEPDDPLFGLQYGLSQSSGADIEAPPAWDVLRSCSKVAVLDSGVDVHHPDLAANLWRNSEETASNGKDDDKNGYVDDYYGVDLDDGRGSGVDENGHGTHVAGIVGAVGDNGSGVAGVCWKASIISARFMDARGRGSTSAAVEAIQYSVREGARILNCSFGSSSKSTALEDAVQYAKSKGALIVVAAGNDGADIDRHPSYPAAFGDGNILAVAASTADDRLASFSNYGDTNVDVAAPGEGIVSTYLDGGYKSLDGTSMAAPYVSGAAALLRKRNPDATYEQLRTALRKKVDKPPALAGKVVYDGRLNVVRALAYIEP
jgi:subtilisin family serine protease